MGQSSTVSAGLLGGKMKFDKRRWDQSKLDYLVMERNTYAPNELARCVDLGLEGDHLETNMHLMGAEGIDWYQYYLDLRRERSINRHKRHDMKVTTALMNLLITERRIHKMMRKVHPGITFKFLPSLEYKFMHYADPEIHMCYYEIPFAINPTRETNYHFSAVDAVKDYDRCVHLRSGNHYNYLFNIDGHMTYYLTNRKMIDKQRQWVQNQLEYRKNLISSLITPQ